MESQKPIIAQGITVEWSGSLLRVCRIDKASADCRILASGTIVKVPFCQLQQAVIPTVDSPTFGG